MVWRLNFLLGWPIFRGHLSFLGRVYNLLKKAGKPLLFSKSPRINSRSTTFKRCSQGRLNKGLSISTRLGRSTPPEPAAAGRCFFMVVWGGWRGKQKRQVGERYTVLEFEMLMMNWEFWSFVIDIIILNTEFPIDMLRPFTARLPFLLQVLCAFFRTPFRY